MERKKGDPTEDKGYRLVTKEKQNKQPSGVYFIHPYSFITAITPARRLYAILYPVQIYTPLIVYYYTAECRSPLL